MFNINITYETYYYFYNYKKNIKISYMETCVKTEKEVGYIFVTLKYFILYRVY